MTVRWDETWHRLQNWTDDSAPPERLAAQILLAEGYTDVDPTHPLGGKDGGKDALVVRNGKRWIMAVYFPRGQQSIKEITYKLLSDAKGIVKNGAEGMASVTNHISEDAEIYHLERITTILDNPPTGKSAISFSETMTTRPSSSALLRSRPAVIPSVTGCSITSIWPGRLRSSLFSFDAATTRSTTFGYASPTWTEARSLAIGSRSSAVPPRSSAWVQWQLQAEHYYRVFFVARNGQWRQDLILRRSDAADCWLAATRTFGPMLERPQATVRRASRSPSRQPRVVLVEG